MSEHNERLRAEIKAASQRVEEHNRQLVAARAVWTGPARGMVFLLPFRDLPVYWLVLNAHPDDPSVLRTVPVTDFPFCGPCDCFSAAEAVMICHCNAHEWIPAAEFTRDRLAYVGWDRDAEQCSKILAQMVRGQYQCDPDYEAAGETIEYQDQWRDLMREIAGRRGN